MPIGQKGQKEDAGSPRPVSLTSVLGMVMEQIISVTQHLQGSQGIRPSQCGLMKGRFCLTSLNFS